MGYQRLVVIDLVDIFTYLADHLAVPASPHLVLIRRRSSLVSTLVFDTPLYSLVFETV